MAWSVCPHSYAGFVAMCACSVPLHEGQTVVLVSKCHHLQGGILVLGVCVHGVLLAGLQSFEQMMWSNDVVHQCTACFTPIPA